MVLVAVVARMGEPRERRLRSPMGEVRRWLGADLRFEVTDDNEGGGGDGANVLDVAPEPMVRRRLLGILLVVGGVTPPAMTLLVEGPVCSSGRFALLGVVEASTEVEVETEEEGRAGAARAGRVAVNQKSRVASR